MCGTTLPGMARKLRVEYCGAIYHVLNRGDRREPEKVKITVRLRQETLVTLAWVARRLQMGSVANVNTLLYRWRQGNK